MVCAPTTSERLEQMGIEDMVKVNRDPKGTAYTVTLDASSGVTTGISAADRARTVNLIADFDVGPEAFVTPGHIQPLRARPGGVLERAGHTEASVDLARLAGLKPACVICEILNEDGSMARLPDLIKFKEKHGLKLMSVADLIEYRMRHEEMMSPVFEREIETRFGKFIFKGMRYKADKRMHYALIKGDVSKCEPLVRVHSENVLADLLAVSDMPAGTSSFERAMKVISENGCGVIAYVSRENSGLNYGGEPAMPDSRDYGVGSQILRSLGLGRIRLLTTHPGAHRISDGYGLEIIEEIKI
jgi:3,4-dihydroxy 2-butanone 4-phosphate synthase/GTP cyclohydrolase II